MTPVTDMFFVLSKVLHFLLIPLNWFFILLIAGIWGPERRRRTFLISSFILIYLYTTDFALNFLFRQLEYPLKWYKEVPGNYDAALVLGGMASPGKLPDDRTHFPGSPDRLLHALQLYKLGKVKKIIISGGSGELTGKRIPEATYLKNVLLLADVPQSDIIIENKSRNTHENAVYSKELISRYFQSGSKFLLVTSAWHMKRSMGCFQHEGINVTAFPVDSQIPQGQSISGSLIPAPLNASRWQILIHEYFGLMSYKLSGFI